MKIFSSMDMHLSFVLAWALVEVDLSNGRGSDYIRFTRQRFQQKDLLHIAF